MLLHACAGVFVWACVFKGVCKSHYIHARLSAHVLVISRGLSDITLPSRVYSWQSAQVLVVFSTWHSCRPACSSGGLGPALEEIFGRVLHTRCAWWEKQQNELFEPPTFYKDGQNHGDVSLLVCLREAWGLVSRSAGWSLDVWVVRVVSSDWSVSVSYTHHFMAIFT